ncbi:beta-1,3-galactosyltransferase 5 [Lepeophtheirus salmonis]|uniref:Hexosyltransferase n=1 Tax=Lepeophtheirus salmonis TaxID=72036 RepID=C1BU93_LEPSM|nr:beta-1,3-galactosyltransferase 5-like [Lepeophtheirus salmonis]ACO12596.1 Beta-1,3-galactosyltransferase 5 [Lepeophtheirus salmonis]
MVLIKGFLKVLVLCTLFKFLWIWFFFYKSSHHGNLRSRQKQLQKDLSLFHFPSNPWMEKKSHFKSNSYHINNCTYRDNRGLHLDPKTFLEDYLDYFWCLIGIQNHDFHVFALKGSKNELLIYSDYQFSIEPELKFKEYDVFFIIFAKHHMDRQRLRNTWIQDLKHPKEGYLFCIPDDTWSMSLVSEEFRFKDMLSSNNDTSMLFWLHSRGIFSQFIVRIESDFLVNMNTLRIILVQETYASNRIYGKLNKYSIPDRSRDGANYLSEREWPWGHYPHFMSNQFYIITGDVVSKLLTASSRVPKLANLSESIYTTGILSIDSNLLLVDMKKFVTESSDHVCTSAIVTQPGNLKSLWEGIKTCSMELI